MSRFALVLAVGALSACATPDHDVADAGDPLETSPQNGSLSEQLIEAQRSPDGCLAGGNALDLACTDEREGWAELLSPPPLPEPPPPPPAPPQQ